MSRDTEINIFPTSNLNYCENGTEEIFSYVLVEYLSNKSSCCRADPMLIRDASSDEEKHGSCMSFHCNLKDKYTVPNPAVGFLGVFKSCLSLSAW